MLEIIICILTFISLFAARNIYTKNRKRPTRKSNIAVGIAGTLSITFFVLMIKNWNIFNIPEIILFVSVCLYILIKKQHKDCYLAWICIVITFFAFFFTILIYDDNLEDYETDVSISINKVICAKDNYPITGSISGSILYVQGSVEQEPVYKYYYQLEDGGIKQGTIPSKSTTIYFVKDGEEAHLETVVTKYNVNDLIMKYFLERSETTYNLYVPEDSVINLYEFDAE